MTLKSCERCAGTGEYPPTGGDVCSWCGGAGEYPTSQNPNDDADSVPEERAVSGLSQKELWGVSDSESE